MTNSDNIYGVFNKQTKIISQEPSDDSTAPTIFTSVDEAKSHIFTDDALTVINETCTQLEWQLVNDGDGNATKLKKTFAFGTKGAGTAAADDWAEQYNSRKQALMDSNTWVKSYGYKLFRFTDDSDHLF